ncbi:MAG: GHKL domain-containing protein [Sphaerochaetaceae bacterium]|nr:GHKL domain-containing protein [Sphaerochaetaceae bacterium]
MSKISEKVTRNISKLSDDQILSYMKNLQDEIEKRDMVLSTVKEGYFVIDTSGKVLYINETAKALLPVNSDVLNRKIYYIDTLITDKNICNFIRKSILHKDMKTLYEFKDKNPVFGERDLSICALVYNRDGSGIFEVQDVTFIKKIRREFSRNESLAAMTTMAAGVAHEIKNPLASMSIYVQLLARKLDKNGSITKEEAEKTISVLNEEIEKLNKMAVDFLYAVKPVNAEFTLDNVNNCINSTVKLAEAELSQEKIKIVTDLAVSLPNVKIDNSLIQQCILNLVRNSMQAKKDGQEDMEIRIRSYLDSNNVCISVEDNGCGMTEEQMVKIFEPYYTTKATGTGLGLTNIYKIVKEHGGEITVNSTVNAGTVFTISLPVPSSERYRLG